MVVFKLSTSAVCRRFLYFGELRHFFRANLPVTAANFRLTEPVGRLTCLRVCARRSSDHAAAASRESSAAKRRRTRLHYCDDGSTAIWTCISRAAAAAAAVMTRNGLCT